jgi:hypothetical protein
MRSWTTGGCSAVVQKSKNWYSVNTSQDDVVLNILENNNLIPGKRTSIKSASNRKYGRIKHVYSGVWAIYAKYSSET